MATTEQITLCLDMVSELSAELWDAESNADVEKLAAIIGGCQLVETRAQSVLQGQIGQNQINDVKAGAVALLGPGWRMQ